MKRLFLPALAALAATSAIAQNIAFTVAPFYPTPNNWAHWLELADMDGDGDLDVVVVTPEDETSNVSVIKNRGNGTYDPGVSYPVGKSAQNLTVGDFNADGRPDVVVSNYLSGDHINDLDSYVTVYMNNGSGGLVGRKDLLVGENAHPQEVKIADFDRDGLNDFAVACMVESSVFVYRSLGNGNFALYQEIISESPAYMDVADVNGDSRPDLIVGNVDATFIYRNQPGAFVEAQYVNNFPDGVQGIAAADFDNDGDQDYVTSGRFLTFYRNTGGSFAKVNTYLTGENLTGIRAADIDGDGDKDILGATYLANAFSVYYNDGLAGFAERRDWGVGDNPWMVAIGDVNMDGKLDVVAPSSNYNASDFTVAINLGNKNFVARREYFLIGDAQGVDIADMDGDGFMDVVTGVYVSNQDRVAIFFGKPEGSQEDAVYLENIGNNIPTDVVVADFNHDGRKDIAASIFSPGNRVRVWMNLGNRTFSNSISLTAGGNPSSVAVGDLNGDGHIDIVNTDGAQLSNTIHIFLNNGDGTFQPGIVYNTLLRPSDVTIGDWDNDGDRDLLVTHYGSTSVLLYRNTGTASFNAQAINVGNNSGNSVPADVNNDGWLDAVIATGNVTVLINNQSGGFTLRTANIGAQRVSMADYDNDGYLDLAGTAGAVALINIGRNDGTGTFTQVAALKSGYSPDRSASGDLNGDGKPEIAVANGRGGTVTVFTNVTSLGEQVVNPSGFTLNLGTQISGTLDSLKLSDDLRLRLGMAPNAGRTSPNVQMELVATSPLAAPSRLTFVLEAQTNLIGTVDQRVELFNYTTGQWVLVDQRVGTATDSVVTVNVTTNASQYVQPGTGQMKARVTWKGDTQLSRSAGSQIDQLIWRVQ